MSAIGDDAVLLDDHSIAIIPASVGDESGVQDATGQVVEFEAGTDGYVLAQPADAGSPLIVSDPNGRVLSASSTPPQPDGGGLPAAWIGG